MIATAQRFSSTIAIPRADDIACAGVRPKVATPKVTIYLTDGLQPFDREIGYDNGAPLSSARLQPE
ncbi:hypothetical protein P0D73_33660 [Paraburkholderia sp. RL18-101-BIB-B]|uniref:hypothetical protein n=1 Tax=unclassified Paraburkholderia TaxID=2615204 RepID=UPI0038BA1735